MARQPKQGAQLTLAGMNAPALANKKADDQSVLSQLATSISKDYQKKNALVIPNFLRNSPIQRWISTGSFLLDLAIGYPKGLGLPLPSIVEIYGQPDSGKSLLAYTIMGNLQELGGVAILIDEESTFTMDYARLARLDTTEDKFLYLQFNLIEECLAVIKKTIEMYQEKEPNRPIAIVLDSIAATSTAQERDNYEEGKHVAPAAHARQLHVAMRQGISRMIYNKPIILVFVNQVTATMATMPAAEKFTTFGGSALKYGSRIRLELSRYKEIKVRDTDPTPVALRVRAKVAKSKINPPSRQAMFDVRFSSGIEDFYPVLYLLEDEGVIKRTGTRYVWKDKAYYAVVLRDLMMNDPREWAEMRAMCHALVQKIWTETPIVGGTDEMTPEYDSVTGEVE